MKKIIILLISTIIAVGFFGCDFFLGLDEPAGSGGGSLSISFGAGGNSGGERAGITSGAELSESEYAYILETLRYDITLTGPGGETIERTVSPGEKNLRLTVALGEWRIEAEAYQTPDSGDDVLAGTGELTWPVIPGINAIRIPMEINEGYFEISVQANLEHGRVNVSPGFAFPGTLITVTVEAHNGYKLKEGSFICYISGDRNNKVDIAEGEPGIYTFEMPPADVRVSAEFNKELGFIIEVPEEKMVRVDAVYSYSAERNPPTISWAADETVVFTVSGNYSAGVGGNLKWLVNGTAVTAHATGNSLTIHAQDYIAQTYTLTVMIQADDGLWYSGNHNFTVVR